MNAPRKFLAALSRFGYLSAIEAVFDRAVEEGAIVPDLWHLEVANSLT
ncbi:MAG: hypothetical protein ACLQKK_09670 [Rhodomicrobium sp.]